jgi:hypothetical protein
MTLFVAGVFVVAGLALSLWIRDSNARWLEDHKGRHHE